MNGELFDCECKVIKVYVSNSIFLYYKCVQGTDREERTKKSYRNAMFA